MTGREIRVPFARASVSRGMGRGFSFSFFSLMPTLGYGFWAELDRSARAMTRETSCGSLPVVGCLWRPRIRFMRARFRSTSLRSTDASPPPPPRSLPVADRRVSRLSSASLPPTMFNTRMAPTLTPGGCQWSELLDSARRRASSLNLCSPEEVEFSIRSVKRQQDDVA